MQSIAARLLGALLLMGTAPAPHAVTTASAQRFASAGSHVDAIASGREATAQRDGRFELQATLSPSLPAPAIAAPALQGSGYVLNATASASSLVCYADTVFRDDFDGDIVAYDLGAATVVPVDSAGSGGSNVVEMRPLRRH